MPGLRGVLILGSIGLKVDCLVITILFDPRHIKVPALCAFEGTIISNSVQYCRNKFTKLQAASVLPPLVYKYNDNLSMFLP